MITPEAFTYYDLRRGCSSPALETLFPDFRGAEERIAILSPHDDDALLGAGYALLAARAAGATVYVFIFCDGRAGYSHPTQREQIVATRQQETLAAYAILGLQPQHVLRFDYPDFSLGSYVGWLLPWGGVGTMDKHLRALRELEITRLLLPNGYREHTDHEAAYRCGAYDGPQVGDAVLADWGLAPALKSYLIYAVWGDFSPEDALVTGSSPVLRGNRAILAAPQVEATIGEAIRAFASQARVIEMLIQARRGRRCGDGTLEIYQAFHPRPPLDYAPYGEAIQKLGK